MMRDEDSHRLARSSRKGLPDESDLILVDPAVLEGQRTRRVDPEHGNAGKLDERAEGLVDEAAIARQRREEAAKDIVERHIVVAGDPEDFVPALAQAFEEFARFAELLGPCTLREIAADDDEVGFQPVDLPVDRLDEPLVMSAEVQIGKM